MSPVGRPPALLLGKTAEEWAQVLDVTRRSVQRWIAHTSTPDLVTAARMADIAGVTLDEVAAALFDSEERHDA